MHQSAETMQECDALILVKQARQRMASGWRETREPMKIVLSFRKKVCGIGAIIELARKLR